ncbi:unnamed protein product [Rangifer tarandus platyrhynchus]|uniref:Uncharacterized protein n=1 Tax=Rangifer tarandus platyrhynchus TaxID=3082113 RepID=A0AC59ZSS9_RANTA
MEGQMLTAHALPTGSRVPVPPHLQGYFQRNRGPLRPTPIDILGLHQGLLAPHLLPLPPAAHLPMTPILTVHTRHPLLKALGMSSLPPTLGSASQDGT